MIENIKKESYFILICKIIFYLFLTIYLLFHIFSGNYGLLSYQNTNEILIEKKNVLNRKENYIKKQQNKISRLDSKNIDVDLLDEKLRENVGIVEKNEIVLFTEDLKNI